VIAAGRCGPHLRWTYAAADGYELSRRHLTAMVAVGFGASLGRRAKTRTSRRPRKRSLRPTPRGRRRAPRTRTERRFVDDIVVPFKNESDAGRWQGVMRPG